MYQNTDLRKFVLFVIRLFSIENVHIFHTAGSQGEGERYRLTSVISVALNRPVPLPDMGSKTFVICISLFESIKTKIPQVFNLY